MASRRLDFAVPTEARRARCRYCLATVYWAPDVHRGPLHAATAIRNGDGELRMEAHIAHCPNRSAALKLAKTQPCPGRGCGERIEAGDEAPVLCHCCWDLLPDTIQAWVVREGRRSPRTASFDDAVANARKILGQLRARRKAAPASTLFSDVHYG